MTDPTPLSPAAQAVMDAYWKAPCSNKRSVAAALRAAAKFTPGLFVLEEFEDGWSAAMGELLMIADELDPPSS